MKRGRTEEIQFGQPRVQPPTGQQRIITTTQPHNVASSTGTTIQYQIPPNVIKTSTPPESVNSVTNLSSQQQQQATQLVVPPQQATSVQYTTSYNTTLGANLVKAQQTTNPQQQQIHVVNASNQVRGPSHKNAVVNATAVATNAAATPNNNISVSSGPGTTGVTGGVQQVITTSMSPGVLPGAGSAAQGPPPPPPQGQAQLQRLKVEDALSYLDQVKYRFGNQPQVYNDFLDIMKEFKSQSIDTPGVIQRVSNLFRGHPELIVGFNTFLPPGYKIEVQANDQGCYLFQVSVSVQPTASSGASVAPQPSPHKYNTIFQGGGQIVQSTGSGGGGAAGVSNVVTASTGGNAGGGTTTGAVNLMAYGGGHAATAATAPGASVPVHGGTTLQQPTGGSVGGNASPATAQNAQSLTTTTTTAGAGGGGGGSGPQVAQNFSSRGDHHRERTISTGSAASNASLPAGVTASSTAATTVVTAVDASSAGGAGATVVTGQQPSQATQSNIHRILTQQIISQQQTSGPAGIGGMVPTGMVSAPTQVQHHQQTTMQQVQPPPEAQTATVTTTVVPTPTATANQPVEFNHAITYVNKIKNRFHTQPEKYKRFLEILHTYQKEQKTYKEGAQSGCLSNAKQLTEAEVYTQVAQLFDNQEDLLREFGQFLPDATSHHNQAAMQQHHMASGKTNSHNLVVNASMHDHQHSQQQQLGGGSGPTTTGTTAIVGLGGNAAVPVVHGGSGKKLGSSNIGGVPGGALANLKVYNSMQPSNLARLQQDREYAAMGADSVGMHGAGVGVGGIPPGSGIPVGSAIRTAGGSMITAGGAVMVEKDRNHHMGSVGPGSGGGSLGGAGGLNAKYIHGASLSALNPTAGLVGGNVLQPGGPNVVSNVMANLVPVSVGSGGGGVNAIKRSPSYASQIGFVGSGGPSGHGNNMNAARDRGDGTGPPPIKRHKPICRDVSLAEASKYGTLNDYAFFDKVRKALRSPDVYEDFLRCLTLYNQEIVSKSELQTLITPFLSRFPDLLKWFQDFLGPSTGSGVGVSNECIPLTAAAAAAARQDRDRTQSELAADVDLSTCKRFGASYCALPKSHEGVKCSGRTSLCRDVLNDTWVSFPTWAEDSTFVTSRKTQYEEFIYRCEDERFELDVVIESNSATIRVLEGVQKKLTRMSQDEVSRFRLDDCLGGTSSTIHQRALRRIYGDKAADIIQGLKKNPSVAVPVVLRRMKAKEEEWREAQKSFNKQWREQNEKYYLKSLDHQGINFKQTDIKALRSKSLFNEIETLFDEVSYMKRHEQNDDSATVPQASGPHMTIPYKDKTILEDAANLLIHHVKRQTGIQKQEKARIKHILRQFVPDLFFAPRQQLSEDEREEDDKDTEMEQDEEVSSTGKSSTGVKKASLVASSFSGSNTSGSFNPSTNASAGGAASSDASATVTVEPEGVSKDRESSKGGDDATAAKASSIASTSAELLPLTPTVSTSSALSMTRPGTEITGDNTTPKADSNGNSNATEDSTSDKSTTIKMEIKEENDASVMQDAGAATPGSAAAGTSSPQQQPLSPPLPPHAVSKHIEEAYTLFFTNNSWYLFLRLHAILCERLRTIYERAQIIAAEERAYESTRNNSTATALRLKTKSEIRIEDYYNTFLEMLKNLLDGNMESSSYEDTLREMFGIHAYIAFTLDRVVQNAVRQLQHCVTERGALECVELFQAEQRRGGAGGLCRTANRRIATELAYQRKAETALQDENCFKIYIYKIDCRVTIELLDTESDDTATNFANTQAYGSYVNRLSNPAATGTGSDSGGGGGGGGSGGAISGSGGVVGGSGVVGSSGVGGGSSGIAEAGAPLSSNSSSSVNSSNLNNAPTGSNTGSGSSSNNTGGSTTNAEVKTETPDEELKLRPLSGAARMPVFLSRNVKQRRKNTKRTVSVTIDGKSVSMGELQASDIEEDTVAGDSISSAEDKNALLPVSNTIIASVLQSTATTHNSKPPQHAAGAEGDASRKENDVREASGAGKAQHENENVGAAAGSTTTAKGGESKPPSSTKDTGGGTTSGGNNNNNPNNINNNNNNIGSNPSLWFGSGSFKKQSPSAVPADRRLPNMNGADRNLLYIDDSEQMKVTRNTYKTSQVQKKNFTMYWHGSLTRSRKSHCRVTTRMDQRFKSVVDRWLDQHVTDSQRASCVDWLLGKRQDLVKSTTSVIVQDNGLSRTPYAPYNRYKVNQLELG
ncbi:paired amphipathic helix protein Sin3a [Anopheles marshallii]|uniref:paired amphipathic helix protein Sin3a n=1 Tax=Anopheles marshallii TaxID=1521116 RepID=UPI00237B1F21|nr:paired amphipathic helix protein Sin3a [Anopheles marshallii]